MGRLTVDADWLVAWSADYASHDKAAHELHTVYGEVRGSSIPSSRAPPRWRTASRSRIVQRVPAG